MRLSVLFPCSSIVAFAMLLGALPATAQTLFAVSGETSESVLYRKDLTGDGPWTEVGPIGYGSVAAIDLHPATGQLFGFDVQSRQILEIDVGSGAGTPRIDLGVDQCSHQSVGLTFDGGGQLWLTCRPFVPGPGPEPSYLWLVDLPRATVSPGVVLDDDVAVYGLFARGGRLYAAGSLPRLSDSLFEVDRVTGEVSDAVESEVPLTSVDFDWVSGSLYGAISSGGCPSGPDPCHDLLFRLDPSTGSAELLGLLGWGFLKALAVAPVAAAPVPALDGAGLAVLVLVLAGAGVLLSRRTAQERGKPLPGKDV